MTITLTVPFDAPPDRVRAYLRDPAQRPQWQSSLRAVTDLVGDGGVGTTWRDVTWPGLRPAMTVTDDTPTLWAEIGTWRRVTASLALRFEPAGSGTTVHVEARLYLPSLLTPAGPLLDALTRAGIGSDLRRAAALVS